MLPSLPARDVIRAFEALGWHIARQRGSHIIMVRDTAAVTLSVPNHDPIAKGTLRALIRAAGLTVDEFRAALP